MSFIKVRLKKETSDLPPPSGYSSWLAYWEKKRNKKAKECESFLCSNKAEVVGHVIKSGQDNKVYILPMCKSCINLPETVEFETWETDLVPIKIASI